MRSAVIVLLLSALTLPAAAMSAPKVPHQPQVRKLSLRGRHHRARLHRARYRRGFAIAPELRGSKVSLLKQNEEIDRAGIERIQNEQQLDQLKAAGELVPLQSSTFFRVDPRLPVERRYCRPWTLAFLSDFSHDYFAEFRQPLQVNSAVRTVEQQRKLRRHNRNAAPEEGETASSHLAGVTVDIAKHGMTRKAHKWVADYLARLKFENVIEPEEERRQAVFHVMVTHRYLAYSGREPHITDDDRLSSQIRALELHELPRIDPSLAQGDALTSAPAGVEPVSQPIMLDSPKK